MAMRPSKRGPASAARLRQVFIISVVCLALYCFLLVPDQSLDSSRTKLPPTLLNNRFLTSSQCAAAFPGLTKEIDDVVAKGPFTLTRRPHDLGPLVARIRDGKLYILSYARKSDLSKEMLEHRSATLHQIAAALLTTTPSEPLPDTIIAFNHEDDPVSPSFSYSRPADPSFNGPTKHYFAIPHFSFYAWAIPTVGSFSRASGAISGVEARLSWSSKSARAVWRGTTWFNNPRAGRVRQDLVAMARDAPWADVQALHANGSNAVAIEDFCRHRYVVHTEGVTYSGRFQYHQLCASVILAPPIAWMQHLTHLVKPAFSSSLDGVARTPLGTTSRPDQLAPYPAPWVKAAWPRSYDPGKEANMVFVAPDWSDLEATVAWLERHPRVAEGIARRQRELLDGGGYFSPAAETCYWRAAIRGWSSVVRTEGQGFEDLEEIPWEEFSLKEIHK
ncbi:glycosyl transferase family 90-domain-containing protein [Hypoxylon sp. FL1857]|nr:glycosyl transferase family 90-domain-containing protein [Hypoxylon sp. FL1857]